MDEVEDLFEKGEGNGINFIPCLKWVQRGVAKSEPEKLKLTKEELAKIINKTQKDLTECETEETPENEDTENPAADSETVEDGETMEVPAEDDNDDDFEKRYNMDAYDDEEEDNTAGGLDGLMAHADPRDDKYLRNPDEDDDQSDIEDNIIKPDDNLLLVGHVDGDASILEVYVYNDDEDALYVHHDILLPSFPMTLEWLNYDPGEARKGNLVAVGSMAPIIDVWDVDIIDSIEPAFSLGQKKSKKRNIPRIGHKDAVLSLSWNHNVRHLMASGSVDETVLIWDLREGKPARTIKDHTDKVQALQWHPMEPQVLLTGCCDGKARIFDCNQVSHKSWTVDGEVEKVLWDHFNPFNFIVATEKGFVYMMDARNDGKSIWTLSAHSEGVNGLSLSSQCPGLLVTGSSDKTMKVWDISKSKPTCISETEAKIGMVHALDGCPDAPFVFAFGGDTPSHNMHVMDVRESAKVNERFNTVKLEDPTKIGQIETPLAGENSNDVTVAKESENRAQAVAAFEQMTVTGGAVSKFKKKEKKKKKKNNF